MRILSISYFPPSEATPGAFRANAATTFLRSKGHEVHRVCAAPAGGLQTYPVRDLGASSKQVLRAIKWLRRTCGPDFRATSGALTATAVSLQRQVRALREWPDYAQGWVAPAIIRSLRVLNNSGPFDVIYASSGPLSCAVVGHVVSRLAGVPWVCEFRDLYSCRSSLNPRAPWRQPLDNHIEHFVVRTAVAGITVSQPLRKTLQQRHPRVPFSVVMNGFDSATVCEALRANTPRSPEAPLIVLFAGSLYGGIRDPTPFLRAIANRPSKDVRLHVYIGASDKAWLELAAERYGVKPQVSVFPPVPHHDAIRAMASADVLLMPLPNGLDTQGMLTTKLFEYIGVRRPVLVVGGNRSDAPSRLVLERKAGAHPITQDEVQKTLDRWVSQKCRGTLERIPHHATIGLSRDEQFARLEPVLLSASQYRR